ncbi:hypothetical protein CN166_22240 [Sinorhizobium medicae]|nr:hypothetical protein [Sinorhizobium medicae]MDX0555614.1 hypothetical protein [Sinorhizobium medicae]MDX0660567.1 hypothetical protein [Sinorhizobium medicae]MDX1022806.1 hypothetical protein [Sinorhizobium medicae]MDX1073073.1 hypothetical protein [Sinorhizobium medicae]
MRWRSGQMVTALTVLSLDQGNIHRSAVYHRERLVEQQQEGSGECAMGRRGCQTNASIFLGFIKALLVFRSSPSEPATGTVEGGGTLM